MTSSFSMMQVDREGIFASFIYIDIFKSKKISLIVSLCSVGRFDVGLLSIFVPTDNVVKLAATIKKIIVKKITAYDSVLIDKKLQEIKETVDEFDNYWFMKNRESHLLDMIYEIENITNWIKEKCGYERD